MLNDTEKEKVTQTQEKEKLDGRRENVHLAKIGLMVFITFVSVSYTHLTLPTICSV